MESNKQAQHYTNGLFLAGSGLAVLLARRIILTPTPRFILAGIIAIWGLYLMASGSANRTAGLMSLIGSGLLILFGGLLSGISFMAGIGLIVVGGISFFSGLFNR